MGGVPCSAARGSGRARPLWPARKALFPRRGALLLLLRAQQLSAKLKRVQAVGLAWTPRASRGRRRELTQPHSFSAGARCRASWTRPHVASPARWSSRFFIECTSAPLSSALRCSVVSAGCGSAGPFAVCARGPLRACSGRVRRRSAPPMFLRAPARNWCLMNGSTVQQHFARRQARARAPFARPRRPPPSRAAWRRARRRRLELPHGARAGRRRARVQELGEQPLRGGRRASVGRAG